MAEVHRGVPHKVSASADGRQITLTIATEGGEVGFSVSADLAPHLVQMISQAAGHAARIRPSESTAKLVQPVESWRLTPHPDPEKFVLDVLTNQMTSSYGFAKDRIPALVSALQKMQSAKS